MDKYLVHYGVKGMKWGIRRNRDSGGSSKNTHNKDYTDKQRKNDRAFYGNRGEKRINKKLNEGYGLRGARHFEVERKERSEKRKAKVKRIARKGARAAESALASIAVWSIQDQVFWGGAGRRAVGNALKSAGRFAVSEILKKRGVDVTWRN